MAAGLVLAVAQTLFAALDSSTLKEICSMFGYKSELEELKGTVSTIKAVLLDAEAKKQELSHEARDWIDKLKDALYDVDDLLDEFNTATQQQKQIAGGNNKISKKVRRFLSRSNELLFSFSMSRDIKKIKKKLGAIASDHTKFGLSTDDNHSIWEKREETCSHVNEKMIVGRDGDKKALVDMLLDSNVKGDVSFVTIVGIGGLGKTTLAQLVYNDDRIKSEFKLRMWVCVAEKFSVTDILGKILMSLTGKKCDDLGLDQLQIEVGKHIEINRYLLVLDDVWNESRDAWVKLQDFLVQGRRGSKIVVTSRSKKVGRAIGNYPIYELQDLSEEDAWRLFRLMAFDKEEEHLDTTLVEIGKDIVKKCANVPLSIRVLGTLLYGHDKEKWLLFQKNDLAKIEQAKIEQAEIPSDRTMAILKFSYFHLTPPLKSCFSCCALFPKDYVMNKDDLIYLWMAHGCIEPRYDGQSIEDAAEEYFWILSQRCFFQEIEKDAYGEIISCKVHDLMHDLALEIAGHELLMLSEPSRTSHLDEKIRHLSIFQGCSILNSSCDFSAKLKRMRTFLQIDSSFGMELTCPSNLNSIISNCRCLRWLDVRRASLKSIPTGIDRLIHLRSLDLSFNDELEVLPKSITNLHNLQILKLENCRNLRALPKHFSCLVNLRHLDTRGCNALTRMPTGLKNLACLHTLTQFVIGGDSEEVQVCQLEDLKALTNLRGELYVRIVKFCWKAKSKVRGEAYLLNKPHLKTLRVEFEADDQGSGDVEAALLEGFQPNCDVRVLKVSQYKGAKLPCWMLGENPIRSSLPGLVKIVLSGLRRVEHLPLLSQLFHLKDLEVSGIPNLEYMENDRNCTPSADLIFFPSLEKLKLMDLPKIKGWWRDGVTVMVDVEAKDEHNANGTGCSDTSEPTGGNGSYGISSTSSSLVFTRLRELEVLRCQNMKSFPPCPHLKDLRLQNFNEELFIEKRGMIDNHNQISTGSCTTVTSSNASAVTSMRSEDWCDVGSPVFALEKLRTDNEGFTRSLPEKSVRGLAELEIQPREESLSTLAHLIEIGASSLRFLSISSAPKLRSLCGGRIEHLTCLQTLYIWNCEELELEDEDEDGMPWKSLHTLSHLTLYRLPKMLNLPKRLQYLTALHTLSILNCDNLTALPQWIGCLTSLRSLHIYTCVNLTSLPEAMRDLTSLTQLRIWGCPALIDRCRRPNGEDYPKIAHVPDLDLWN